MGPFEPIRFECTKTTLASAANPQATFLSHSYWPACNARCYSFWHWYVRDLENALMVTHVRSHSAFITVN
jgi:hypothetical protein